MKKDLNTKLRTDINNGELTPDTYKQLRLVAYSSPSLKSFIINNKDYARDGFTVNMIVDDSILYLFRKWDNRSKCTTYLYTIIDSYIKSLLKHNGTIKQLNFKNSMSLDTVVSTSDDKSTELKDVIKDSNINVESEYINNELFNILIDKYPDIIKTEKDKQLILGLIEGYSIQYILNTYEIPISRLNRLRSKFKEIGLNDFKSIIV